MALPLGYIIKLKKSVAKQFIEKGISKMNVSILTTDGDYVTLCEVKSYLKGSMELTETDSSLIVLNRLFRLLKK